MSAYAASLHARLDAGILNALLWGIPTAANVTMLLFLFNAPPGAGPGTRPWLFFLMVVLFGALGQMLLGTRFPNLSPFRHAELAADPALSLSEKLARLRQDDRVVRNLLAQMITLALLSVAVVTLAR